ncbi:MAG: very short patch repair endonuclease [Eggerthellaceae bacterium]|nr:very short patch repair endonuclease [Eggerthellaceae bacterium]
MQGNKRRDTSPEIKVRKILRKLGYPGYRLDWKKAPGHPDIAYPGRKLAVFINGCFWHKCPVCNLPTPKKNVEYWEEKFRRNRERDERTRAALEADGWKVLVIWEHQLKKSEIEETERYIYEFVRLEDEAEDRDEG